MRDEVGLCRVSLLVFGGFCEAVADGVVEAAGWWEWAEDEGRASVVKGTQGGKDCGGEGFGGVPVGPGLGERWLS